MKFGTEISCSHQDELWEPWWPISSHLASSPGHIFICPILWFMLTLYCWQQRDRLKCKITHRDILELLHRHYWSSFTAVSLTFNQSSSGCNISNKCSMSTHTVNMSMDQFQKSDTRCCYKWRFLRSNFQLSACVNADLTKINYQNHWHSTVSFCSRVHFFPPFKRVKAPPHQGSRDTAHLLKRLQRRREHPTSNVCFPALQKVIIDSERARSWTGNSLNCEGMCTSKGLHVLSVHPKEKHARLNKRAVH